MSDYSFTQRALNIHPSGFSAVLFVTWLVPGENQVNSGLVSGVVLGMGFIYIEL